MSASLRRQVAVAALVVAGITVLTFRHTLGHGFVNWDDGVYVYDNPLLRGITLRRIGQLFLLFYYYAYIPVTLTSHAADVVLWGMNPQGHHLTNLLLHTGNAVGVFLLGVTLAARPASGDRRAGAAVVGMAIAAILFAVHPLRAESVAWISDRKDLLCALFLLPSTIAYLTDLRRRDRAARWLVASFVLFVLAVLSKSSAVFFPVVLLLLGWLEGRRGRRLITPSVPFFVVAAAVAALSMLLAPHEQPGYAIAHLTPLERPLVPAWSLLFPVLKTLSPDHLSPIYRGAGPGWMLLGAGAILAVTTLAALLARRGHRAVLAAWLAYLLALVPNVFGFGTGMQPLADRYSYIATIPLFLLLGGGLASLGTRGGPARAALIVVALAVTAALASLGHAQAARWRSSISLWEYVVRSFPERRDYVDAYVDLGAAYAQAGRRAEAIQVLDRAITLDPSNAKALYSLGVNAYETGDAPKALASLRRVTEIEPSLATAWYNRAIVAGELGFNEESVGAMIRAARLGDRDAREALAAKGIPY